MGYTPDWWAQKKGLILEKRRSRYRDDPAYREAAKELSRRYRDNKRAERQAILDNPAMSLNGTVVPAHTDEQTCVQLGIKLSRLRYLHKVRYLPAPLVTKPARLYTGAQIALIADLETFLRSSAYALRAPHTERGAETLLSLKEKITTIASQWEN